MCENWPITEYTWTDIPADKLSDIDVEYIDENYSSEIDIKAPSPLTDNHWRLRNKGFVGHIELPSTADQDSRGLELKPGIELSNVFRMLEYAYDLNQFRLSDEGVFESDTVEGFYDRIANILAQSVIDRRRKGLYRSYAEQSEMSQTIRGKIDFAKTLRKPWNSDTYINYREMTANNEDNQILLYTLSRISASDFPREETFQIVRQAIRSLQGGIDYNEFQATDCTNRQYNRLNTDYKRLHALCRFILDTSGPSHEAANSEMIPYTVPMDDLFELFVYRWLKQHLPEGVSVENQVVRDLGETGLNYRIDIVLFDDSSDEPVCVVDTKYREPDSGTPKTSEVNQVLGYALREGVEQAFIVYPVELDTEFHLEMNGIMIDSLKFGLKGDIEENGQTFLRELDDVLHNTNLISSL